MYNRTDIIEILKNSNKFLDCKLLYGGVPVVGVVGTTTLDYIIGIHTYDIDVRMSSKKIIFSYYNYNSNFGVISSSIPLRSITERKIINGFRKIINIINKLDNIILEQERIEIKIKELIISYFTKEYEVKVNSDQIKLNFKFPNSYKRTARRVISTAYDVEKEDSNKIVYNIIAIVKEDSFRCALYFDYNISSCMLKLTRKEESFSSGKDITKIIRSEKLRNLALKNED